MEEIQLEVQLRNQIGTRKIKEIRYDLFVPAIVYGDEQKPTAIQVDRRAYERIMRHRHGQSVLFHLNVMEEAKKIQDEQSLTV